MEHDLTHVCIQQLKIQNNLDDIYRSLVPRHRTCNNIDRYECRNPDLHFHLRYRNTVNIHFWSRCSSIHARSDHTFDR